MHTCIHCGRDMVIVDNWPSQGGDIIYEEYQCKCIYNKAFGGYVSGYTKYILSKKLERLIIHWDRYTIVTDYGNAFYKENQCTTVKCSVVTIYDEDNGLQLTEDERMRVNSSVRPLSGIAWCKKVPPKDFSGMGIDDIKRWVSMLENFQ